MPTVPVNRFSGCRSIGENSSLLELYDCGSTNGVPAYSEILKSRKRRSSREANRILGRTGKSFWQPESYDHWIRDDDEKARIRRYVRNNPVKAGLCRAPEDWKWSSARPMRP